MRTLHILPSIDPRGGGPMEGVRQMGSMLVEQGHVAEVLTLDAPDEPFIGSFPLKVVALGPSMTGYRINTRLIGWLREHAREYDAIFIEGIWQFHAFGTWLALRKMKVPYYVFTHGMLDPWFKKHYPLKHLKKWIYWPWADYRVLRDAKAVIFTCDEERRVARESFWLYKVNEAVTSYGTREPPQDAVRLKAKFLESWPALANKRVLLFLGRMHEKKGCDLLVGAFARVASDPQLHLLMAGPDQGGLTKRLQDQAQRLGIADRITWTGMVSGELKWGAFYTAEVFVLPSHQENFGIAVAEAMGCGVPVLISDRVNIWRDVVDSGSGFASTDTEAGTVDLLERWLETTREVRASMGEAARRTFTARFTTDVMVANLLRVV